MLLCKYICTIFSTCMIEKTFKILEKDNRIDRALSIEYIESKTQMRRKENRMPLLSSITRVEKELVNGKNGSRDFYPGHKLR